MSCLNCGCDIPRGVYGSYCCDECGDAHNKEIQDLKDEAERSALEGQE